MLCAVCPSVAGCGVTPGGGRRCRPERPDAPRLHVHVHVFLRGLTAGVMTQPCCDQQLAGPQGSLSAVLGASTNVCSCLGKHLDVTAGRTVHACAGGRCPLHARCPSLGAGGVWLLCIFQRLASRGAHTGEDGLTCPGNGQTVAFPALEICVLLSLLTLGTAGQVCGAPCWAAGSAVCCVHARRGPCPPCSVTLGPFPGRLRSCAPGPAVCCELCACVSEWGFLVLCRL